MAQTLKEAALSYARDFKLAIHPLQTKGKRPASPHGFQDATTDLETIEDAWTKHPTLNIGAAMGSVSGGIVCIDIDVDENGVYDGNDALDEWESEHGKLPETATAVTGRGGTHLFYRCDRAIPSSTNAELHIDVRGDGGYVMMAPSIHPNGNTVFWDLDPEDVGFADADDNVYALIDHVRPVTAGGDEPFELPDGDVGEGERDVTLFKLCCSLWAKNVPVDVIRVTAHAFNAKHCKPPLPKGEVEKKITSATKYPPGLSNQYSNDYEPDGDAEPEAVSSQLMKGNTVYHNVFGQVLISEDKACFIEGAPAIWDGTRYAVGWREVQRGIVRRVDRVKKKDQTEICHYLTLNAPTREPSDPSFIGFANGVLDMGSGDFADYTPDMVITNVIPHDFSWDAYDESTDKLLDRVSCGNDAIRANLEEIVGLCMFRSNEYGVCPVLIGNGANGKSTYINMLRNVLGVDNTSSLDLSVIGRPFQAGRLLGKLANLGDDISNEFLRGDVLSVFKKIVTGEMVYTDVKNADGFEFRPYCTLVFSCNEMPNLGDASDGVMRRLFPIPFDARFSADDPEYDPQIGRKVQTEEAASYLCKLGVYGLQRVMAQNGLSPNDRSRAIKDELAVSNNNVLAWMSDEGHGPSYLDGMERSTAYGEYAQWCENAHAKPVSKNMFGRRLKALYGLETKTSRDRYDRYIKIYALGRGR